MNHIAHRKFDSIAPLLNNKRQVYIYGAGGRGLVLGEILIPLNKYLNWDICFVDADKQKQHKGLLGINVFPPDVLAQGDKNTSFVVICATDENAAEMTKAAEQWGYVKNKNLFDLFFFLNTLLSVHFLYNLDMVYISSLNIVPSTICNLNCKGCLNFNPYIKKHTTYTLDSLKEDCDALFDKIDVIGRFQITGGEPLLFDHLVELIQYVGEKYRQKIVRFEVVSNGTIVPSDELCLAMKANTVNVVVDDYRNSIKEVNNHYNIVVETFRKYDIPVLENYISQWFNLTPYLDVKRALSDDELKALFDRCENPYATLVNKSISACNYAHYAEKAGIIESNSSDYFDLTTQFSKYDIVAYRLRCNSKGYTELCNHCAGYRNNCNWIAPAVQIPRSKEVNRVEMEQ
jgi:organic radical activating enzyme